MRFTADELERYARQIVLHEVGGRGQERLRDATVLLVGLGGLGVPASLYLAGAGIGRLILVDDDTVAPGNLHRQILYVGADVGRPKVEAAAERLGGLNPGIHLDARRARVTADNAAAFCAEADLVLDGSDTFLTRSTVAAAAATARRPLVSGSVQGFEGQATLFAPHHRADAPCFRCLFPDDPPADALPTARSAASSGRSRVRWGA